MTREQAEQDAIDYLTAALQQAELGLWTSAERDVELAKDRIETVLSMRKEEE